MLGKIELNNDMHTSFSRSRAFMPPQMLAILAVLKFLIEEALCWCTRPVEVFLHRRFGVRSHSVFQTMQICFVGGSIAFFIGPVDLFLGVFCLAAAVLAVYHRVETVRWEKSGKPPRYSWSNGDPIPIIWAWAGRTIAAIGVDANRVIKTSWICRFYEPGLLLGLGIGLYFFSKPLGYYLACTAVAVFVKNLLVHLRFVNLRRDSTDARLISGYLVSIQKAAQGSEEEVFHVVQLAVPAAGNGVEERPGASPKVPQPSRRMEEAVTADNVVRFKCDNCKKGFRVDRRLSGRRGKCRGCGHSMVVAAAS